MNMLSASETSTVMAVTLAPTTLVLPGGAVSIFCFEHLDGEFPEHATLSADCGVAWSGLTWQNGETTFGLGVLGTTRLDAVYLDPDDGGQPVRLMLPPAVSTQASDLAEFLDRSGAPVSDVLTYLQAAMSGPAGKDTSGSSARFHKDLLHHCAECDGVIEMIIHPETGGLFLQGWASRPLIGQLELLGHPTDQVVHAAAFPRADIPEPAAGFCLFIKDWEGYIRSGQALFVIHDGRPIRLDPVPDQGAPIDGESAQEHVRAMVPKLEADEKTRGQFKRIVRPRFDGQNTLAAFAGPVAAAVDRVLRTPSGGLLVAGWLLDPQDLVERVLLKSTANLYVDLNAKWHRTERGDLNDAFAGDARFAGLLDPREDLHGFICAHVATPGLLDQADLYLELVLKDERCLFLPCTATPCDGPGPARAAMAMFPAHDPGLATLIDRHGAPFLSTVPRDGARKTADFARPLGVRRPTASIAAIMPVTEQAQLQPIMSCLADTEEAGDIDLVLVMPRDVPPGSIEDLDHQFKFYGLAGQIVLTRGFETSAERMDIAISTVGAKLLLLWNPTVLPKHADWLRQLIKVTEACETSAAVAPILSYEDGSIFFGGLSYDGSSGDAICALAGFGRHHMDRSAARPVGTVPAEILLLERDRLLAAGGVAGNMWGDRFIGQDLSQRLRSNGVETWCADGAEFWMLDPANGERRLETIQDRVDAALIALRTQGVSEMGELP